LANFKPSKPEPGVLKINVDGAFDRNSHTGAAGAVLRDNNGAFRAALARFLDSVGSALLAEAESLRDGVRLIPEGSIDHIILETNSLELVLLWKNRVNHRSEVTAILRDVEEMLASKPPAEIIHVRRSANFAAHLWAQHAFFCLQSFVWSLPPSFLLQCLQSDYNNSI
jgi:ribonuclease HI